MSMSTKNIHETFRTCFEIFFAIRKEDIGNFAGSSRIRSDPNRFGVIEGGKGALDSIVGGESRSCRELYVAFTRVHAYVDASHALVQEWPLIGWKNARSRVCRRRVCEVMVSTSFYGLARARTYIPVCATSSSTSPLYTAPCKTHTQLLRACYFASAPTDSLDPSWKQQITTRVQLDKRNRFSIPDIPTPKNDLEISFYN